MSVRVSRIGSILRINDTIIDTHGVVSVSVNSCSLVFQKHDARHYCVFVCKDEKDVYSALHGVQRELYNMRQYNERKD